MYHTHENGVKSWNKIGMEILYKNIFKQSDSSSDFNERRMNNSVIWHWLELNSMKMLHYETRSLVI